MPIFADNISLKSVIIMPYKGVVSQGKKGQVLGYKSLFSNSMTVLLIVV